MVVRFLALGAIFLSSLSIIPRAAAMNDECVATQDCVDNALPVTVDSCLSQHPECSGENSDRFALSAGVLADRAIAIKGCESKQFSSKKRCLACFANATRPLRHRYDSSLFHGLLGTATRLVKNRGITYCSAQAPLE